MAEHSDYVPLIHPQTGKLVARFAPTRDILEVVERGMKAYFDLRQLRLLYQQHQAASAPEPPADARVTPEP